MSTDVCHDSFERSPLFEPFRPWGDAKELPLSLMALGRTLVFAPHPDDESLGCGGLLLSLAQLGMHAEIVFVTDGSRSHPNSLEFPSTRLIALRHEESLRAAEKLGIPNAHLHFLEYTDSTLSELIPAEFAVIVQRFAKIIDEAAAQTIFVPRINDPHGDHRIVHFAVQAARQQTLMDFRVLEYPIWMTAQQHTAPMLSSGETLWKLDIRSHMDQKQMAIKQHRSQVSDFINDDPGCFRFSKEMLTAFAQPYEYFFEQSR